MKNNDQELLYSFGELSDAELTAFEKSLGDQELRAEQGLRETFCQLRKLNQDIPEPQISFARVRHAIESSPKAAPVWPWQRWLIAAAPIGALAVMAIFLTRGGGPQASIAETASSSLASVTPDSPDAPAMMTAPEPAPQVSPVPPVVASEQPVVAKPSTTSGLPVRRSIRVQRRLVANVDFDARRASAGLTKQSDPANGAPVSMRAGAGSEGDEIPPPSVASESVPRAADPVVVVTSTPDAETGANAALEVSKKNDVVLGG